MYQQKGFSLSEVLISLMLITTSGLVFLEQQQKSTQLLKQFELRAQASHFLDQINEDLFVKIKVNQFPIAPSPYKFDFKKNQHRITLQLQWGTDLGSILRRYDGLGYLK